MATRVRKLAIGLTAVVGLYAILLGVLLTPDAQRFALYANKFNTLGWQDVHSGEAHGFAKHQVTPFNLVSGNETLYAWHILPLDQYIRNEAAILRESRPRDAVVPDLTQTLAYKLLTSDEPSTARVVVSFHGNAGHIAQGQRAATNRYMSTLPNTHVFTVDYRGFGHSTGTPTEAGLIIDGIALVNWVVSVTQIPPERIVILGQSLGTAVSAAVVLHFADPGNALLPSAVSKIYPLRGQTASTRTTFAGIVLAAPFDSVPTLLLTYRIGGLLPLLLPLRPFPFTTRLLDNVVDTWVTGERLREYYRVLTGSPHLYSDQRSVGSLQIIHALNDADIPYHQTELICERILSRRDAKTVVLYDNGLELQDLIDGSKGPAVLDVRKEGLPSLRFEFVDYGGHNRIVTYTPVAAAVVRAFENLLA